jgi:histidinol dehydrogenase
MKTYLWTKLSTEKKQQLLARPSHSQIEDIREKTQAIIQQVKEQGDQALLALTAQYDKVFLDTIKTTAEEINQAKNQIRVEALAAIKAAMANIETYHKPQIPQTHRIETSSGIFCERQARPISRVGLYIPGGSAPLISTVLMLGIPARLANCPLRILCTPPNKNGKIDPHILVAAQLCDIHHIYKVGGSQAIAAMAYGTQSIPKVDKIFGPGNSWVTQAKALVAQDPNGANLDLLAGPSEVLVIADDSADPEHVAADLLSQAEHGSDSQVILITLTAGCAEKVIAALKRQLPLLPRRFIAEKSLFHSRIIIVDTLEEAVEISNAYAPEHLILQCAQAEDYVPLVQNAGAVFLGKFSPETMGDYLTGSNHVLPTAGYARSCSGLGVMDFMKFISVQTVTAQGLSTAGGFAEQLAELEGLFAHKNAVSLRLKAIEKGSLV